MSKVRVTRVARSYNERVYYLDTSDYEDKESLVDAVSYDLPSTLPAPTSNVDGDEEVEVTIDYLAPVESARPQCEHGMYADMCPWSHP